MKTLLNIMATEYNVGIGYFDTTPILWSAEKLADQVGVEQAKKELAALNRKRDKLAIPTASFPFGHRMF